MYCYSNRILRWSVPNESSVSATEVLQSFGSIYLQADWAPSLGCIIVSPSGTVLSSGYSRELPGNTHAEQCAIDKIGSPTASGPLLQGASLYTTMEPCSVRLSGNVPCVKRILDTGISTVYVGVEEPRDFVECEGTRMLREAGKRVILVDDDKLSQECLAEARRGH